MVYFFKRNSATVSCEMRPSGRGEGYDIIIMKPGQPVVTEHLPSSADIHKRWCELQEGFKSEGWWGPTATHD